MKKLSILQMVETSGGDGCAAAGVGWTLAIYGVIGAATVAGPVGLAFAVVSFGVATWGVQESCGDQP